MLNAKFFKAHTNEELCQYIGDTQDDLARAERQMVALKRTQKARPNFTNYNPIAADYLTIGNYIEMSEAIQDGIREELALLTEVYDHRRGLNQTIRML